jgi:hypothetical protein
MNIKISVSGILKRYFEQPSFLINLSNEASLEDLFQYIHQHWAEQLPPSIWNSEKRRFRGPVIMMSNQKVLKNKKEKLNHNQHIELFRFVSGG